MTKDCKSGDGCFPPSSPLYCGQASPSELIFPFQHSLEIRSLSASEAQAHSCDCEPPDLMMSSGSANTLTRIPHHLVDKHRVTPSQRPANQLAIFAVLGQLVIGQAPVLEPDKAILAKP